MQATPVAESGPPTRTSVDADGCRIACWRRGGGDPVLFIHGTAARLWGELPALTAAFAEAIEYDRRSFGASAAAPLANLTQHADDAASVLAALVSVPAVVVGWSIGGVIAAELALRHPALVRALVLLEPPYLAKQHPSLALLNGVVGSILIGLVGGAARGGRRFSRWVFDERDGTNTLDRSGMSAAIEANAAAIGTEIRGGTGEHLDRAALAGLNVPATVMAGDRSRPFLAAGAQRMAHALEAARFVMLPGASHMLQLEQGPAIAEQIRSILMAPSSAGS